jgi:hypothetical protein
MFASMLGLIVEDLDNVDKMVPRLEVMRFHFTLLESTYSAVKRLCRERLLVYALHSFPLFCHQDLGRRHVAYGAPLDMFPSLEDALILTLSVWLHYLVSCCIVFCMICKSIDPQARYERCMLNRNR